MKTQKTYYPLPIPLPETWDVMVEIPSHRQAEFAIQAGKPTPLDLFIYHHEPAGMDELEFRARLGELLNYMYLCGGVRK